MKLIASYEQVSNPPFFKQRNQDASYLILDYFFM